MEYLEPYEEDFAKEELLFLDDAIHAYEEDMGLIGEEYLDEVDYNYLPQIGEDNEELNDSEVAETLREVLNENYSQASDEELLHLYDSMLDNMSPEEAEWLKKTFRKVKRGIKKTFKDPKFHQILAKTVLPIAGTAIGTFGGPAGMAIGGSLSKLLGDKILSATAQTPKRVNSKNSKTRTQGSAAAAQLLKLTNNPNVLKSLLSLSMGSQGAKSIKISKNSPSVPVGSFLNLLSTLTNRAMTDADALARESHSSNDSSESTAYLRDTYGNFVSDPTISENRASILLDLLNEAEAKTFDDESIAMENPYAIYMDDEMEDYLDDEMEDYLDDEIDY